MPRKRAPHPAFRNEFTSRGPRNAEEIKTCIAMLEDSPFWDPAYDDLDRQDIVNALEGLLLAGSAYIDIVENPSYTDVYEEQDKLGNKKRSYPHNFHSVWFIFYPTLAFTREILSRQDIPDVGVQFLKELVAHCNDKTRPTPAATPDEMIKAHRGVSGCGLYCLNFFIWHPDIDLTSPRVDADADAHTKLAWESGYKMHGGLAHHAWINNVASDYIRDGYAVSGHKLLYAYARNVAGSPDLREQKYLFCLTKDRNTSEALDVPSTAQAEIKTGSNYRSWFLSREPTLGLSLLQQHTCYLIALGYLPAQIAKAIYHLQQRRLSSAAFERSFAELLPHLLGCVAQYQREACETLRDAHYLVDVAAAPDEEGRGRRRCTKDRIGAVICENLHEVRSLIAPLYPWPDDHVLRRR